MPDLRVGGILERSASRDAPGQQLSFDRTKGNKNTLRTPDDATLPEGALEPWLGSLQAQAFNRMYALDHTTLVEGGAGILSASDDIGRMLFQSAAGIEHLGEALQKLQAEADTLWASRKSGSRIYYQALDAFDTAHADFKKATVRTKDWKAQHDALAATEAALAEARKRDVDIRRQLSRLERIRRVRPMLLALDAAQAQRNELLTAGDIPLLAENADQVLGDARQELVLVAADLQRLGNLPVVDTVGLGLRLEQLVNGIDRTVAGGGLTHHLAADFHAHAGGRHHAATGEDAQIVELELLGLFLDLTKEEQGFQIVIEDPSLLVGELQEAGIELVQVVASLGVAHQLHAMLDHMAAGAGGHVQGVLVQTDTFWGDDFVGIFRFQHTILMNTGAV